jgi:hypothetical protein
MSTSSIFIQTCLLLDGPPLSLIRGCSKNNAFRGGQEIILDFVRKSKLPLKKICAFVKHCPKRISLNRQVKRKEDPKIRRCFEHHPVAFSNI